MGQAGGFARGGRSQLVEGDEPVVGRPGGKAAADGVAYVGAVHKLRPRYVDAKVVGESYEITLRELAQHLIAKVVGEHPVEAAAEAST